MSEDEPQRLTRTFALYGLTTGVSGFALFASTWNLWLPQEVFPQVPLLRALPFLGHPGTWPAYIDYLSLCLIAVGLIGMMLPVLTSFRLTSLQTRPIIRHLPICYAAGFTLAVIIDQHRLQPWAVQFLPLSLLFFGVDFRPKSPSNIKSRLRLARLLVLGIYFWSAVGKFDFQFAHTVGHGMLAEMLSWIGVETTQREHNLVAALALMLPLGEILGASLLCMRRTRKVGVYLISVMHLMLFFVLGPLGLDHRLGVLLWNAFSLVQVWLLFGSRNKFETTGNQAKEPFGNNFAVFLSLTRSLPCDFRCAEHGREAKCRSYFRTIPKMNAPAEADLVNRPRSFPTFAGVVILLMLVLPVGERFGFYDHWLSWALYAPHSSRTSLVIPISAIDKLPESLRRLVDKNINQNIDRTDSPMVPIPLDQWSLDQLNAPIYPQARFQLGVCWAVVEKAGIARDARVQFRSAADRFDGTREIETLTGLYEIKKMAGQFLINAQPSMSKYKP